jgi:CheY-like chemotaxis protein
MGVKSPIIAMTANAMKQARQECLDAGMSDYITKPFKPRELWDCLLKYLEPVEMTNESESETQKSNENTVVDVIDRVAALSYVGGNGKVYNTLLCKFLKEQPILFEQLEQFIAVENYSAAYGIAHQMKGVSATVGAMKLPVLLAEIEQAFADGVRGGYTDKMLIKCKEEFAEVINAVTAMILSSHSEEESKACNNSLNKEKALELIKETKSLLERYMSLSDEQIEVVKDVLSPVGEKCEILTAQLYDFELEAALETICEIEKELISDKL